MTEQEARKLHYEQYGAIIKEAYEILLEGRKRKNLSQLTKDSEYYSPLCLVFADGVKNFPEGCKNCPVGKKLGCCGQVDDNTWHGINIDLLYKNDAYIPLKKLEKLRDAALYEKGKRRNEIFSVCSDDYYIGIYWYRKQYYVIDHKDNEKKFKSYYEALDYVKEKRKHYKAACKEVPNEVFRKTAGVTK